jgi:hypothetical protein
MNFKSYSTNMRNITNNLHIKHLLEPVGACWQSTRWLPGPLAPVGTRWHSVLAPVGQTIINGLIN